MKSIALVLLIPALVGCSAVIGLDEGTLEPEGCGGSDGGQSPCAPDAAAIDCDAPAFEDPTTHHCYENIEPNNWQNLLATCLKNGEYLAAITSQTELALLASHEHAPVWIGGSDQQLPQVFTWSNGEPWSFAPWLPMPPGGPKGDARCVMLSPIPSGFAVDDCGAKLEGVCERSPSGSK